MTTDSLDLLRRYVNDGSEAAFAELAERHLPLVFSAALRQVGGDAATAEDVAQAVLTDLARKAPRLLRHPSLSGWLYTSTRHLAAKARRTEQRRRVREQTAHDMNQLLQAPAAEPLWEELRPVLDDAMHDLHAADREAVLLRYFERRPLAEVGARLGLTENAARMRVDRALDKLRAALAKRGVASTAAALALVLADQAIGSVPAGLADRIGPAALAGAGGGGGERQARGHDACGWGLRHRRLPAGPESPERRGPGLRGHDAGRGHHRRRRPVRVRPSAAREARGGGTGAAAQRHRPANLDPSAPRQRGNPAGRNQRRHRGRTPVALAIRAPRPAPGHPFRHSADRSPGRP